MQLALNQVENCRFKTRLVCVANSIIKLQKVLLRTNQLQSVLSNVMYERRKNNYGTIKKNLSMRL